MSRALTSIVLVALLAGCAGQHRPDRPDWLQGESSRYSDALYLLGRGSADDLDVAKDRARADIAKVFQVAVVEHGSDELSYQRRTTSEGSQEQSAQRATRQVTTDTDQLLQGVEIAEVWRDERARRYYALAILSRQQAAVGLRQHIGRLDTDTSTHIERARAAESPLKKIHAALQAVQAQRERAGLQQSLQAIDPSGQGTPPIWNLAGLETELRQVLERLQIKGQAHGEHEAPVQRALDGALAAAGFGVPTDKADYVVNAELRQQPSERVDGWHWGRGTLEIFMTDASGAVVGRRHWNLKVAARQAEQVAERLLNEVAEMLKAELRPTVLGFAAGEMPAEAAPEGAK